MNKLSEEVRDIMAVNKGVTNNITSHLYLATRLYGALVFSPLDLTEDDASLYNRICNFVDTVIVPNSNGEEFTTDIVVKSRFAYFDLQYLFFKYCNKPGIVKDYSIPHPTDFVSTLSLILQAHHIMSPGKFKDRSIVKTGINLCFDLLSQKDKFDQHI